VSRNRALLLVALVAFVAALAGVFIGRSVWVSHVSSHNTLHELLHEELDLDAKQRAQISNLEAQFAIRRRALELELRADNARLAEAFQAEHGYGPQVTVAIDQSHRDMGELQKETLAHIFAMRAMLKPDQARKLDQVVVEALTADSQ
jgi:hypothetical protein